MKFSTAAIYLVAASVVSPSLAADTNPVTKVLGLLSDLEVKIVKEGAEAQKTFAEFGEWCEDRSKNLHYDIKTGKASSADLKATIEQETGLIASAGTKIEELAGGIATDEADLKAATEIRTREAADFVAEEKELSEVIDTLQRAVTIIERETRKGGASMVQLKNAGNLAQAVAVLVQAASITSADASRITALAQVAQEDDDAGAPAAAVYESHSANIVDTLGDLAEKAEGQLAEARSKETAAVHNFELLRQSLEDEIKFANKDMSKTKTAMATSGEKKAEAEGDLQVTSSALAADETALADLHHDCMTQSQDFEAATKSRGEELKALAEAKKIIGESTGGAADLSYGLDQVSFVQRSSLASGVDLANFEAVRLVRDLARKHKSAALTQLASRMAAAMRSSTNAGSDPFAKVKGLISDMLDRLLAEGEADATKEAWCDKETAEANAKKADKTAEIAKLSNSIDQKSARSASLKQQVADLQKSLADIASSQAEMTKIRQEEHGAFVTNKADMEQGLEGVKLALKVLREYYAKDDKAHASADGASSGIIGLLEVVESDFSTGLAEMVATEQSSAASYDKETKENQIETASKGQDVKYKTKEAASLDQATAEATSDRAGVQEELDATVEYLAQLDKQCISRPDTYAERKARREAELAGLKSALEILEGEAVLLQKGHRSLRGIRVH